MSKEPSVETKIREILTNPDKVGNLEITHGNVEDGDLDEAVRLIAEIFSTQQAQYISTLRGEVERHTEKMPKTRSPISYQQGYKDATDYFLSLLDKALLGREE